MKTLKRIIHGKIFVVISPPSLYITRFLTYNEANNFIKSSSVKSLIVLDIFGTFTKRYLKKEYPILNPFD